MLISYREFFIFSIISFFIIDIFGMSGYLQIFAPIFFVMLNVYLIKIDYLNSLTIPLKNKNIIKYILILIINIIYIYLVYYKFSIEDPEFIENMAGTVPITLYFSFFSLIYFLNYNNFKIKLIIGLSSILIPIVLFLIDPGYYGFALIFSIELWEDFLTIIGFYS